MMGYMWLPLVILGVEKEVKNLRKEIVDDKE